MEHVDVEFEAPQTIYVSTQSNEPKIISFIERLPLEILSSVFLVHQLETLHHRSYRPMVPPILQGTCYKWMEVAWVCRQWRHVALNMSQLWKPIILAPYAKMPGTLAMSFIQRSYPLPVDLQDFIRVPDDLQDKEKQLMYEFCLHLAHHPERLGSVLFGGSPEFLKTVLHTLQRSMPDLTTLSISFDIDGIRSPFQFFEQLSLPFQSAPKLRKLYLGRYIWSSIAFLPLPRLTHLYLEGERIGGGWSSLDYRTFLEILHSLSTSLKVLSLRDAGPRHYPWFQLRPLQQRVRMDLLEEIEVHSREPNSSPAALFFTHSLILPDTVVITWLSSITILSVDNPLINDSTYALPPAEHLQRITAVVVRPSDENIFRLEDNTLFVSEYLHHHSACAAVLERLAYSFPNVRSVGLSYVKNHTDDSSKVFAILRKFPLVNAVHLYWHQGFHKILGELELPAGGPSMVEESDIEEDNCAENRTTDIEAPRGGMSGAKLEEQERNEDEEDEWFVEEEVENPDELGAQGDDPTDFGATFDNGSTPSPLLSHLSTLIIYTGGYGLPRWKKSGHELQKHGLQPIRLSQDFSMTRRRRHLGTKYTLIIKGGGFLGLTSSSFDM